MAQHVVNHLSLPPVAAGTPGPDYTQMTYYKDTIIANCKAHLGDKYPKGVFDVITQFNNVVINQGPPPKIMRAQYRVRAIVYPSKDDQSQWKLLIQRDADTATKAMEHVLVATMMSLFYMTGDVKEQHV